MTLRNEIELENTRRKLSKLEQLIEQKVKAVERSSAYEISLKSMRATAEKLRLEILQYEASHQTT